MARRGYTPWKSAQDLVYCPGVSSSQRDKHRRYRVKGRREQEVEVEKGVSHHLCQGGGVVGSLDESCRDAMGNVKVPTTELKGVSIWQQQKQWQGERFSLQLKGVCRARLAIICFIKLEYLKENQKKTSQESGLKGQLGSSLGQGGW